MYEPNYYTKLDEDRIAAELCSQGVKPRRVVEPPYSVYERHKNAFDMVLAFVEGGAEIRVGGEVYQCKAGDRLHINGQVEHSATIGPRGVVYLMTMLPNCSD